jgi:hypothetical protein
MTTERVEAAREAYFESGRYMRGDGMYQTLFNGLKLGARNTRFIWLYEIYDMWHTQRLFMAERVIVARAVRASVDADFAQEVAGCMVAAARKFNNLSSSLAFNKAALLDVCLNQAHYHAVCMQLITAATTLLDALDGFMDTLLFNLREEVTIMDTLDSPPPHDPYLGGVPRPENMAPLRSNDDTDSGPTSPRSCIDTPFGVSPPSSGRRSSSGWCGSCPTSPKAKSGKRMSLASLGKRLSMYRSGGADTPRSPRKE